MVNYRIPLNVGRVLKTYRKQNGESPFEKWMEGLGDVVGHAKISIRIERVRLGNLGDYRVLGRGLVELKVNYGPGYRVYIGQHGHEMIVLLCGGDKSSQRKDIKMAYKYWNDYWRNHETLQRL